jgi:hypothetical protein
MVALDAPLDFADSDLHDARESLDYWERRVRTLPRHAVRKRREARVYASRWRERVAAAERARYGAGALGFIAQLVTEGRLPLSARRRARRLVRFSLRFVTVAMLLLAVLAVATLQALAALLHALV